MRMRLRAATVGTVLAAQLTIGIAGLSATARAATDGPYQDVYYVNSCATDVSVNNAPVFSPTTLGLGFSAPNACATLGGLQIKANRAAHGDYATWAAETPAPYMRIIGANAGGIADCNLNSDGFHASYFYGDEGTNYAMPAITIDCHGGSGNSNAGYFNQKIQSSRYFGWQASCQSSSGCNPTGANGIVYALEGITLEIQDTTPPTITPAGPNNLYLQSGWVRGSWPTNFDAADAAGVCVMISTVNGSPINSYTDPSPDTSTWLQCPGNALGSSVDTTKYQDGAAAISLTYSAMNAAGATAALSKQINVDNAIPSVSLTGPTDALSTAGTQYVTATGSAGPSGIAGISCSVDGGSFQYQSGSSRQAAVSGVGPHTIRCVAQNRALDVNGQPAVSPIESFALDIRQPTGAVTTFARIADAARCTTVKKARHCHDRTIKRRITVTKIVRRHGKHVKVKRTKVIRVPVPPHVVDQPKLSIAHGASTTVSGYLGVSNGTPLAGQSVAVLAAPDNGLNQYAQIATATTNASGEWTATVPAGPSRLIASSFAGSSTLEPVTSAPVTLTVPAKIKLLSVTRRVPWHGTVWIIGKLYGCYLPPTGALVRMRIGQGSIRTTFGVVQHVTGDGVFKTNYQFGHGPATLHERYWVSAEILPTGDYAYAAADSARRYILVGGGSSASSSSRPRHRRGRS